MDLSVRIGARNRVVVVGAGMGGLAAAADLARRGAEVTVCERAATPGGKMRRVQAGGASIDAGPTVFTMRRIFEGLFDDAGERLSDHLDLVPAGLLARHAWRAGGRLDLFADTARSAEAIGDFAGAAEARAYLEFCARSAGIFRTLEGPFITGHRPSPLDLVRRLGLTRAAGAVAHRAAPHAVGGAGRPLPRPAAAPVVRALRHLCRRLPLAGASDAHADRPC